jgi:hypothetical protein
MIQITAGGDGERSSRSNLPVGWLNPVEPASSSLQLGQDPGKRPVNAGLMGLHEHGLAFSHVGQQAELLISLVMLGDVALAVPMKHYAAMLFLLAVRAC